VNTRPCQWTHQPWKFGRFILQTFGGSCGFHRPRRDVLHQRLSVCAQGMSKPHAASLMAALPLFPTLLSPKNTLSRYPVPSLLSHQFLKAWQIAGSVTGFAVGRLWSFGECSPVHGSKNFWSQLKAHSGRSRSIVSMSKANGCFGDNSKSQTSFVSKATTFRS